MAPKTRIDSLPEGFWECPDCGEVFEDEEDICPECGGGG